MADIQDQTSQEAVIARLSAAGRIEILQRGASPIVRVTADSRQIEPGTLFVAVEGSTFDGHNFLESAIEAGAVALVVERPITPSSPDVSVIQVDNSRRALAEAAALLAGDPASGMTLTAVTGTNGKTTTAWLIAQGLRLAGGDCGYIGTLGYGRLSNLQTATHTTPDAVALQAQLAKLRDDGLTACALEASSHAIDQDRVSGISFDAAVFTNLTRDHLDYHGDSDAYFAAKAKLFENLEPSALAVINQDDPVGPRLVGASPARAVTYGRGEDSDIVFTIKADRKEGLQLRIDGTDARFRLSGTFNAYNLAAAYGALAVYGLSPAERIEALSEATPAPGRFELIRLGGERVAIIDYAHTPDALKNVLEAARGVVPAGANLWCVFGCGGDRDTGKRPIMGGIAEEMADKVVVTSDNPRTEDPEAILDDVRKGVRHPDRMHWLVDRREAIRRAVQSSGLGDVVVVAGKGPEPYQIIGTESLPFSDQAEVRRAAGVN